jgi:hypothetical protein
MSKIQWNIIPAEIKNDAFYNAIINLISQSDDINNILEIGASSGDGSTEAFQIGKRNKNIKLFSIEVCTERFNLLKNRYSDDSNFFPYNISSVKTNDFPSKQKIIDFYKTNQTNLNKYPLDMILGWYDNDINYININNIKENGIEHIKKENNIDIFDCVLIDGSEFTGLSEYNYILGAKYILLDDINAFKTFQVNQILKHDLSYQCLLEDSRTRNGFAIYKKIL